MEQRDPLYDTIYDLEEQTWKALTRHGSELLPYVSKDCIMFFPLGLKVSSRSEPAIHDVLMSEEFIPWKSFYMSDVEVTPIGADGAVISYVVKATRTPLKNDEDLMFRALISSTWRKDAEVGKWLLCFHQQTPFQVDL